MATKNRSRGATKLEREREADRAAKDRALPNPTAEDAVKGSDAHRSATADEVREAGQRASVRWASLLKRLAE